MIDDAKWYTSSYNPKGATSSTAYTAERASTTTQCGSFSSYDCSGESVTRTTNWTGKIALAYPSDYGYASSGCYAGSKDIYNYDNTTCKNSNWMFNGSYQWLLSPHSNNAHNAQIVYSVGGVYGDNASNIYAVRPVTYLKSNIVITGGSGTSSDPYTLDMGSTTTITTTNPTISSSEVSGTQTFNGWTADSNLNTSTAKYGSSSNPTTSWTNKDTKIGASNEATYFKNLRSTEGSITLNANWTGNVQLPTISNTTGYTCKFNTKSDGTGTSYNSGATYTPSNSETEKTLYTVCDKNSYTVSVTVNNGTVVGSTTKTALFLEGTNFNLTPSNAYYKNPTVNCDNATGEMNGNTLQVTNVTGNTTCTVTYKFEITPKEIADIIYPVGSIIKNDNSSFDPNVFYPGTTWVKESGVGFEYASGTKTAGSTGGYTDAVVPSHTHKFVGAVGTFDSAGAHTHTVSYGTNGITTSGSSSHKIATTSAATKTLAAPTAAQGLAHTHTVTPAGTVGSTGTTTTNANLPSYYVVNIWRRTN